MYTFRYRNDVSGVEERKQVREVLGSVKQMTKSEARRRIKEFMVQQEVNTAAAKIPSVVTFAQTVKHILSCSSKDKKPPFDRRSLYGFRFRRRYSAMATRTS
jgi:hypothetical protein